jgi:transcription elongation factor Elf1
MTTFPFVLQDDFTGLLNQKVDIAGKSVFWHDVLDFMFMCPHCGEHEFNLQTIKVGADKYYDVFECRQCLKSFLVTQAEIKPLYETDIQ